MKALLLALVLGAAVDGGLDLTNLLLDPRATIGAPVGFVFGANGKTLATIYADGGCSVTWADGGTGQEKSALCANAAASLRYVDGP